MKVTVEKIAEILGGSVEGNPQTFINGLAKIEEADSNDISFLANPRYTPYVYSTRAGAVLVSRDFKPEKPVSTTLIRVDNPYAAFTELLEMYNGTTPVKTGIEPHAFIHPSAQIGKNVYIGSFAYIDEKAVIEDNAKIFPHVYVGSEVRIGENTVLYPNVTVYHQCQIGNNCVIHAGTVIGSDGFGFASDNGARRKVPQIGNVIIGNNVEIGANTTIDRATLGHTIIHDGVKLDNQIQIAHNVEIGENTVIAAKTGISGSTKVGKNCSIGGQVGMAGHLRIGNNVQVGAQSGITRNVKDGEVLIGSPALPAANFRKSSVLFKNLAELYDEVKKLKAEIKSLKSPQNP